MSRQDVHLSDRFDLTKSPVLLTGTQALARLMLLQSARDRAAGLNTAGYVTGYRGSPLGAVDIQMKRAKAELDAAVAASAAAQPAWAATNPQKRGRVMMKFVSLLNRDMDKLAEALSREHGKTIPDAKGDIIRGLEVAEYCIGAPQMLKGEFSEGNLLFLQ